MPRAERGARPAAPAPAAAPAGVVVAGVAVFWIGTLTAGVLAPGYAVGDDYVSSLAGRGSSVAVLGVTALAVLGTAHLVAAAGLRGAVGGPLTLAGLAGLTVAAFRIKCPGGAAGCGFEPDAVPPDAADTVHGLAVVAYELGLVAAMVVVAAGLARSRRGAAVGTLLAALGSVVLLLQVGGADNGWWQRAWLVVNTGWLVWLVTRARVGGSRNSRETVGGWG